MGKPRRSWRFLMSLSCDQIYYPEQNRGSFSRACSLLVTSTHIWLGTVRPKRRLNTWANTYEARVSQIANPMWTSYCGIMADVSPGMITNEIIKSSV